MPQLGMEPIRREALMTATIAEIGARGSLDVTVAQIARRAGMSSALAHHYFGGKADIFLAAMRHVMTIYGAEVRGALAMAATPRDRAVAITMAGFGGANFRPEVVSAWLNFYVLAQKMPEAARLLSIYHRRLHANLTHALRPDLGARAGEAADRIAALIDGIYLREGLSSASPDRDAAVAHVVHVLDLELERGPA